MTVQDVMEGGHNHLGQLGTYDEGRGDHMSCIFSAGSPSGNSWDNVTHTKGYSKFSWGWTT